MKQPVCRRVLLKLSGEALAGGQHAGLDFGFMRRVCDTLKECLAMGVQMGIVIGGGNFWRGAPHAGGTMERSRADQMGMLATVMNCLAFSDVCEQAGIPVHLQTAVDMPAIAERFTRRSAVEYLSQGHLVLFAAGTGSPYFSTDTGAVLRAAEINAELILLAKNIDGVYSADPRKDPTAVRYDHVSYDEVLAKRLAVMDLTAVSLAMENKIPLLVFALEEPENIIRALTGEAAGTFVGDIRNASDLPVSV